jgi:hypothetical protein
MNIIFLGILLIIKAILRSLFKNCPQKGLKVLFALKKYMLNFGNVPADLSCKLVDTLIRPILIYTSKVWFMKKYLSIYESVNRSRSHGTICDTLSLGDTLCFKKINHRYCKTILGIRNTACNLAATTELGRFPLDSFIKTQVMMYYSHIHSDKINPLINEACNLNESMHDNGIFTWYTFAKEIFAEFKIDKSDFEALSRPFKIAKISIKKYLKKMF